MKELALSADSFIEESYVQKQESADLNRMGTTPGRQKLASWLNKNMKIEMTDGRTLIGVFLCTDQGRNVILGSCSEYLKAEDDSVEDDPRFLGLAMVPGHHIVSIHVDYTTPLSSDIL